MKQNAVVVDDDLKVVELLAKTLNDMDFSVHKADNGRTALTLLHQEKPGLLISDLLLPGIHGSELCREVKHNPQLAHTKIILITSVYKESTIRLEMNCNPDGLLAKPFGVRELAALVEKVMNIPPHPKE